MLIAIANKECRIGDIQTGLYNVNGTDLTNQRVKIVRESNLEEWKQSFRERNSKEPLPYMYSGPGLYFYEIITD